LYRKALRTSSGAALLVPFAAADPWPHAIARIRAAGFVVAALTPDAQATPIGPFVSLPAARGRLAVLFGSEGTGLTPEVLALADVRVRIPIAAAVDSLNIATAAGIALHRLRDVRQG
jgi:tRNA G18 (ribose-2'-O)-methylase SpoU